MQVVWRVATLLAVVIAIAVVGLVTGAFSAGSHRSDGSRRPARSARGAGGSRRPVLVTVSRTTVRTIPAGFLGVSMETDGLAGAGGHVGPFDPALARLIVGLSPGARPVLRIGGDSTDYSWRPVPGQPTPAGVHYPLTDAWLHEVHDLARATDARLLLGLNLQSASAGVAIAEARAMESGIGAQWIGGFELGNEPELYRTLPRLVRTASGDNTPQRYAAFVRLYAAVAGGLPAGTLAGPSIGSAKWLPYLGPFLQRFSQVRVATVHRYPLKRCVASTTNTIGQLLSDRSSDGLAASLRPSVRAAHLNGRPLRVDELNSVSCGGEAGVSDTFASALWALKAMFAMVRGGVDGVNIHTRPLSYSELFDLQRAGPGWQAAVRPEYYGLLAFARAAPAGARLLRVSAPRVAGLDVEATRASDGEEHVVLINTAGRPRTVALGLPGSGALSATALRASSLTATSGVSLGGQSFGPETGSGVLAGPIRSRRLDRQHGRVSVRLPAGSAVLLSGR